MKECFIVPKAKLVTTLCFFTLLFSFSWGSLLKKNNFVNSSLLTDKQNFLQLTTLFMELFPNSGFSVEGISPLDGYVIKSQLNFNFNPDFGIGGGFSIKFSARIFWENLTLNDLLNPHVSNITTDASTKLGLCFRKTKDFSFWVGVEFQNQNLSSTQTTFLKNSTTLCGSFIKWF